MDVRYNCVVNAYSRSAIEMIRGSGVFLFDQSGRKYLDFASGVATVSLGHCHPYVVSQLEKQINILFHCSNLFTIPEQQRLAARLVNLSFADKVFFCSTGAEAVESAIKFIRRYYYTRSMKNKNRIVTLEGGFHGRTIAAISAGGGAAAREGFDPLLPGFDRVPRNDIDALRAVISADTAAVLLEPIQSEGGVYPLDIEYLKQVRKITRDLDILLCFDEVQCGYGRTGSLFYYQTIDVEPDILTCAKAMGNGFPVAACLVKQHIAEAIIPGSHGSTYGGNPMAMAAANAVLDLMTVPGFFEKAQKIGQYLGERLLNLAKNFPKTIVAVRGVGCMWGIEVNRSAQEIVNECLKRGLIITRVSDNKTLRMLPPLIIERIDVDDAVEILSQVIQ